MTDCIQLGSKIRTCQPYPFHVASLFVFNIIHIPLWQIAFLLRMSQAFEVSMLEMPSSHYFKRKEISTETKMAVPNKNTTTSFTSRVSETSLVMPKVKTYRGRFPCYLLAFVKNWHLHTTAMQKG